MILVNENDISDRITASQGTRTFTSDFHLTSLQVSKERAVMRADLHDKLCNRSGAASLGMLTTVVDIVTSSPALATCAPDWTATQDLTLHASGWLTEGPVVVDANLIRIGKKTVHVRADVYDGRGITDLERLVSAIDDGEAGGLRAAARSLVTFARLPRSAAVNSEDYNPGDWIGTVREYTLAHIDDDIYTRLGMRILDARRGVLELELTPFVANMIGTIQGGAQALLAEHAAHTVRPDLVATDFQAHYLSQVKRGPARSYVSVVREATDHAVLDVRLVDAGADEQVLALTTVTMQRPPGH
ncbi:acyl-CoA thioesterase domain-containing protein [Rhodococcus sp. CH91]|uniref:acyl-CoA thioesterase domain-containing protein n=1 Tax=Rhodococcus sp. CH91 TaxID=2910256 RepID=UPI0035A9713B